MGADVEVLCAGVRVGANQLVLDRRQRGCMVVVHRCDLGPAEDVVVQHVQPIDVGLDVVIVQAAIGGPLADELGLAALRPAPRTRAGSTRRTAPAGRTSLSARGCCPSD